MARAIFVAFVIVFLTLPQLAKAEDSAYKTACVIEANAAAVAGGDLCDKFKTCCDRKCGGTAKSKTCKLEQGKVVDNVADTSCTCAGFMSRANILALGAIMAAAFVLKRFN